MTIRRAIERAAQHATSSGEARRGVLPAPALGLDLIRPAPDLGSRFAIRLENFTARHGRIETRPGWLEYRAIENETNPIGTVVQHGPKLFAASPSAIWDVTETEPVAVVEDQRSNRWQTATLAGSMIWVNGTDAPRRVDSAGAWTAGTWSPETLPVDRFSSVSAHRGRLYFTVSGSSSIYYGGPGEISGALTSVDLGLVHSGGPCVAIGSLSIDGGAGPDDLAVFVMADATALLYRGAYPGDDGWELVGRYALPPLVGDRPLLRWGGDLLAITREGYTSLRQYLGSGDVPVDHSRRAVSARITPLVQEALKQSSGSWDAVLWPDDGLLIVATPDGSQHVLDIQSRSWSVWRGWSVRCWCVLDDGSLLFGAPGGKIAIVTSGAADGGAEFACTARSGWDYLGTAYDKQITAVRPHLELDGADVALRLSIDTDYQTRSRAGLQVALRGDGRQWEDEPAWNSTPWGVGTVSSQIWSRIARRGAALSLGIDLQIAGSSGVRWFASDVQYDQAPGL